MDKVKCRDCGTDYYENLCACPVCGSKHKIKSVSCSPITIGSEAEITGMKAKKPALTGRKKNIWDWSNEKTVRSDNGTPVRRFKLVDRENDHYEEIVTDLSTGEIIHECNEPLSEHQGHGSAKNKSKDKEAK